MTDQTLGMMPLRIVEVFRRSVLADTALGLDLTVGLVVPEPLALETPDWFGQVKAVLCGLTGIYFSNFGNN